MYTVFIKLLLCNLVVLASVEPLDPFSDDFINIINSKQTSWIAGRNFPLGTTLEGVRILMGFVEDITRSTYMTVKHSQEFIDDLPEYFDPREKWPNCPTLNEIRDQGCCGSCWAFSAVEVMTDRVCIYSNGTQHFHFSAEDLMSCCSYCGNGCLGGGTLSWQYWIDTGIVSGGNYNSSKGCIPYEIPSSVHKNCAGYVKTPTCQETCRKGYNITYQSDKRYGKNVYKIVDEEKQIMAEIYKNGPVDGGFLVYEDFLTYKSGVYQHLQGNLMAGHAVKIMGWGVENGNKYWLIANSWNSGWGDKGFFKMLRGENHSEIEAGVVAGEPLLE